MPHILDAIVDSIMESEYGRDRKNVVQEVHHLANEYRHVMKKDLPDNMDIGEATEALRLMRHYPD